MNTSKRATCAARMAFAILFPIAMFFGARNTTTYFVENQNLTNSVAHTLVCEWVPECFLIIKIIIFNDEYDSSAGGRSTNGSPSRRS